MVRIVDVMAVGLHRFLPWFADVTAHARAIIAFNAAFDMRWLLYNGKSYFPIDRVREKLHCLYIAFRIAFNGRLTSYSLKSALSLLHIDVSKAEQTSNWARRPLRPAQLEYAAHDVVWLARLREYLSRQLRALGLGRVYARDRAALIAMLYAPAIMVDVERWGQLVAATGGRCAQLRCA